MRSSLTGFNNTWHRPFTVLGNRLSAVAAMIIIGECGASIGIILPGLLSVLVQVYALRPDQVALIASAENFGLTIGTLALSGFVDRIDRRLLGLGALLVASLADLITAVGVGYFPLLMGLRFLAGVGEGLAIIVMVASFAGLRSPERIFAIEVVFNTLIASAFYQVVKALTLLHHPGPVFFGLAGLTVLAALALTSLPPGPRTARQNAADPSAPSLPKKRLVPGVCGLVGMFMLYSCVGAVWPLVGEFGLSRGLSHEEIAAALSRAVFGGLLAGFVVSATGVRIGRRVSLGLGLVCLAAVVTLLSFAHSLLTFTLGAGAVMFFWLFTVPHFMAVLALIDPRGRIVSFAIPMQFLGLSLGPLMAAGIMHLPGSQLLSLSMYVALLAGALVFGLFAERQAQGASPFIAEGASASSVGAA